MEENQKLFNKKPINPYKTGKEKLKRLINKKPTNPIETEEENWKMCLTS